MRKKIAVAVILFLVAGIIVLSYFFHQGRKTLLADPFKPVGTDACLVLETPDIQRLFNSVTTEKGFFGEIGKIEELSDFYGKLRFLSDQLNRPYMEKILHAGPAVISFHPVEAVKLRPLLSMTVPAETGIRQIKDLLKLSSFKDITEEKSGRRSVLSIEGRKDTLFITVNSGLLLAANSSEVFYRALKQAESGTDVRNLPGFQRILLTAGRSEDKLYVIFRNLSPVIKHMLKPGASYLADRISELAGTAGVDIHTGDQGLTLSGYSESADTSDILDKYKYVTPGSFETYRILPSATALFESVFVPALKLHKSRPGVSGRVYDMAESLYPFISNEMTRAYLNIKGLTSGESSVIIYRLTNRFRCEQLLQEEMKAELKALHYKPDDQTSIPVYSTNSRGLADVLLPGFAPGFRDTHYAFFDSFMITGNSYSTITKVLYDNILKKTLANDIAFCDFEEMLPSRAGYYFYCVPSYIVDFLSDYLKKEIIDPLAANRSFLEKIQSAGYQFASINNMIYNNLSVRYVEEPRRESVTEWETLLDTLASIKPFFFTNHNTGAKEIFVQDLNNNVYLINSTGRVLWKVPVSESIAGPVYMIDYYRNGKYQLLFSGRNMLHLLDRNGNYVARYPVRLRSPATNPLALFDYDNNKNYRLVIAGEDKMVYAYDREGNVVKGWKPFRTSGHVISEAAFFRVSGKDYIVVADEASIYFLDRSGNIRLQPEEAVTRAKGSGLRLVPGSSPSLICTAPDGTVQNIYFDGRVKKFSFRSFSFDHSFDFFDVDSDGFGEYVFIDGGILYLYDHNKTEMFAREFGTEQLGGPIYFNFSSTNRKIGVFDVQNNLIYLIGKDGKVMNGFPLRGASMFSISRLTERNHWNLIVGGTDRFLYNYKLVTEN